LNLKKLQDYENFINSFFLLTSFACAGQTIPKSFSNAIRTKHFVFKFNGAQTQKIKDTISFSEGFIDFIEKEYFAPNFKYPINVLIFPNKKIFQQYLNEEFQILYPPILEYIYPNDIYSQLSRILG